MQSRKPLALATVLVTALAAAGCVDVGVSPAGEETKTDVVAETTVPMPPSPATRIPAGERLFYLSAAPGTHYGSLLGDGQRVDVIGVFESGDAAVAMTLLQNAAVVDESGGRIGLAVTAIEAESLALAEAGGTLSVLVRSPADVDLNVLHRTTLREAVEDLDVLAGKRKARLTSQTRSGDEFPRNLPHGERGVVLQHNLPVDVARKGSRLDVFLLGARDEGDRLALELFKNVHVAANVDDNHFVVALSVEEASALLLAQRRGTLRYMVRNPEDEEVHTLTKMTLRQVLEDLEVIQEKRRLRGKQRRPKRKVIGIEIHRDGLSSSKRSVSPPPRFRHHGVNPFTLAADDPLSTFAADVDTGSFTIGRRELKAGRLPTPASVRVEEWVNYFTYAYPPPTRGAFAVDIEAAPSPFDDTGKLQLVRIGVKGRTIATSQRKPVHLTFLVDVSGSMATDDKLPLVKESLRHLVANLREHDTVALVTYAGSTQVLLRPTTKRAGEASILSAIDNLSSGGGTNMGSGFDLAYGLAAKSFVPGHENRVIVLSDGDTNIGAGTPDQMLASIAAKVKQGVTMSAIGFGTGNYRDSMMEQLANRGNGNYYYVDDAREAKRIFGDALDGTLTTIAKDVKLQVEFDPASVVRYRLIGYENRDIADKDFRNDAVDAGEIGAGHTVTALYEVELTPEPADTIATVRVRHKPSGRSDYATEHTFKLRRASLHQRLSDASDDFCFAAAVAAFAEILRKSPHAAHLNLDWVLEVARKSTATFGDREEFVALVQSAREAS